MTLAILAAGAAIGGLAATGDSSALLATLAGTFQQVYAIGVQFADYFQSTVLPTIGPLWAQAAETAMPVLEGVAAIVGTVLVSALQNLFALTRVGFGAWATYMGVVLKALKPVSELVGWLLKQLAELLKLISSAGGALAGFVGIKIPTTGGENAAGGGGGVTINAPVTVSALDSADTARQIADAVKPGIDRAAEEQRRSADAAAAAAKARRGANG